MEQCGDDSPKTQGEVKEKLGKLREVRHQVFRSVMALIVYFL
jgi:hypothetical protein